MIDHSKDPKGKEAFALKHHLHQCGGRVCPLRLLGVKCKSGASRNLMDERYCICDYHHQYYLNHGEI